MGASALERKAKKAAAAEYYKAFAKLNSIPGLKRISSSNKRDVEDALGDSASFRTRNLSRKTDKLAREINKDDQYKNAIDSYNDRYSILKDQIANKSTTRYLIDDSPGLSQGKKTKSKDKVFGDISPINGLGKQSNNKNIDISGKGINLGIEKKQSSFSTNHNMYATKEEAMASAAKKMESYNNSVNELLGKDKPRREGAGMLAGLFLDNRKYTQKDIEAMQIKDPSRFIREEKFDGFNVLYRNLDKAESAANDINTLSKNIMDSDGMKSANAYAALAEKLKPLIKRDARNIQSGANNGQSLVSNELASATPYLETL